MDSSDVHAQLAGVMPTVMAHLGEAHLAERLESLRKENGWSQDRLAQEMAEVGVPIPQSAISKIERPGASGRRAISLDEALGFAIVFRKKLTDLLIPSADIADLRTAQDLERGHIALLDYERARDEYQQLLERVARRMAEAPGWRDRVFEELDQATVATQDNPSDSLRLSFLTELVEAYRAQSGPTP